MADRRVARWEARRWLRGESSLARVRGCGTKVVLSRDDQDAGLDAAVKIVHGGEMEAAGIRGLSACGSVWACPRCAARIASGRADELRTAFTAANELGAVPMMMTRTAGHALDWTLSEAWSAVLDCWRRMTATRAWKSFRAGAGVVGVIRATEVVLSPRAGWHVHLHAIFLVKDTRAALIAEVGHVSDGLIDLWASVAADRGLMVDPRGQGFQIARDPDALGAYVTKAGIWDLAAEAAMGATKTGHGASRSPFELLADAVAGDRAAARSWSEFEEASKGRSALSWGRGLRALLGIKATTDDDLAAASGDGHEVARLSPATWADIESDPDLLVALLRGVEAGHPWGTVL